MTENTKPTPDAQRAMDYARELMERAMQLARAQLDMTESAYGELSREFHDLLSSPDPAALLQGWQKVMEGNVRRTTENATASLKNAIDFQTHLIRITQDRMPELSLQLTESLAEARWLAPTPAAAPAATPRQAKKAGEQISRVRKAA